MKPSLAEVLGRKVREVWVEWAREQPDPKPSWLKPWEELTEAEKDVDVRIGVALWLCGRFHGWQEERERVVGTVVSTVGGTVEGHPTSGVNYLQRLRELVRVEEQAQEAREMSCEPED